MDNRPELRSLTGLRGVAALWVLWYHACDAARTPQFGFGGYLGVDIFFVLSGFVLAYNYAGVSQPYAGFLWKRLARIYPVHLVSLAAVGALAAIYAWANYPMPFQYTITASGFWRSLALVHAWQTPIDATWNVPSWSISAEWAAYLAFPLILALISRVSRASALLATVAALYLCLMWALSRLEIPGARSVGMLRIAAEFTAGVALHRLWTLRRVAIAPLLWLALMLAVAIALETRERFQALPLLPVLACPIVYGLANSEALAGRLWLWLGRISYSLYMVHWPVLILGRTLVRLTGWSRPAVIAGAALVAIGVAALCYRLVEQPARRAMLGRLRPGATLSRETQ